MHVYEGVNKIDLKRYAKSVTEDVVVAISIQQECVGVQNLHQ